MIALSLIAVLVGLIWGTLAIFRGSLIVGCLAYLIVAACFGYDFLRIDLGPAPLTLDRLALGGLVAAFVVQRRLGRTEPKPLCSCDVFLGLLLVWLAISTFTHDYYAVSAGQVTPLWRLLAGYIIPATVYWIARQAPLTRHSIRIIRNTLICFGLYLAVTGILEIAQQWSLVFPWQIADRNLGMHFGRARGPMLTSVSFGSYLVVGFLAGWIAWPRLSLVPQSIMLFAFPLGTAAVYFSYTSSVWLGAALGLLIALGTTLRGKFRNVALGSCAAVGILFAVANFNGLSSLEENMASNTPESTAATGNLSDLTWQVFQHQPMLGYGFGHFREAEVPFLQPQTMSLHVRDSQGKAPHNTILSLFAETGVLGLALFLAMCLAWWRNAWALHRNPSAPTWARHHAALFMAAFGVYACQSLFHELSFSTLDNSLLFFLAGVTVSLRQDRHASSDEAQS